MTELKTASGLVPRVQHEGDVLLASVKGEVDLNNSPELRQVMLALIAKTAPKKIVLNLGGVPYMDSSAIAVMVELLRKILPAGKLVLTDLQPRVKGLLEIARLNSIFTIVATEADALR
jgi:anti-sigma B factor antagonist